MKLNNSIDLELIDMIGLIFSGQLFERNKSKILKDDRITKIYIVEHDVYFTKYKFHKMKLVLHRATMKRYKDYIEENLGKNVKVRYINFNNSFEEIFIKNSMKEFVVYDTYDRDLTKELIKHSKKYQIKLSILDNSPNFICNVDSLKEYYDKGLKLSHVNFYKYFRCKHSLLMKDDGKPEGGKWSFDTENRKPFPKDYVEETTMKPFDNSYIDEAKSYVNKNFPKNHGSPDLYLPVMFEGAKQVVRKFIKGKAKVNFGKYEDAVSENIDFGSHSVLSAMINIGYICPLDLAKIIENAYYKKLMPLQSAEGYIRQLFWREYMAYVYIFHYKDIVGKNYFDHDRPLDKKWYTGTTGIYPIDHLIKKALRLGYLHHIERLMYMGNIMLLFQTHPKYVFKWFMEMTVDAISPWVMVGNVYGMSQYSCGSVMMTRPYFSSSNYIEKMSDFKKKSNFYPQITIHLKLNLEWYQLWDILYYYFIYSNRNTLKKNYATARSVSHWNKKSKSEMKLIVSRARFILNYY